MLGYTTYNEPIAGLSDHTLRLLSFRTYRSRLDLNHIGMAFVYQCGEKKLVMVLGGKEPEYTFDKLMAIGLLACDRYKKHPQLTQTQSVKRAIRQLVGHSLNVYCYVFGGFTDA